MIKAFLLPVYGESKVLEVNDLKDYQQAVGGLIDVVSSIWKSSTLKDVDIYINDEGLLIGLKPNYTACLLTGRHIVGDVLVTGECVEDKSTSLSDAQINDLSKLHHLCSNSSGKT